MPAYRLRTVIGENRHARSALAIPFLAIHVPEDVFLSLGLPAPSLCRTGFAGQSNDRGSVLTGDRQGNYNLAMRRFTACQICADRECDRYRLKGKPPMPSRLRPPMGVWQGASSGSGST